MREADPTPGRPDLRLEAIATGLRLHPDGIYRAGDRHAVSYAEHGHATCFGVEDDSFWFRHRNRCIEALVRRHPPGPGPLLDIGGGNGFVAQGLEKAGFDVVLLEPGETGAMNARHHRGLRHVACSTLQQAAFLPGSVAAAGLFDVIEHVADDRALVAEIAALLPRGGRLYLTVPCHRALWSEADIEAGHVRRYDMRALARLLADHFSIDFASYFFAPLVLPQLLLRSVPYRLGLRRGRLLSTQAEHGTSRGSAVRLLETVLATEARALAQGRKIPVGASAIVAASRR